jgi:2-amino-4-hydroxy-6-hydroxymethyldihydropteridine diphosphokinase
LPSAFIGIGSNLGDRAANCLRALDILQREGIRVAARSSFCETKPWGFTDQPDFINMAARVETSLPPEELLRVLLQTEKEMGRVRAGKWGPRIIDLDLLLYEDIVVDTAELDLPHPLMHEREFVLRPLAEIAPDALHPVFGKTVKELLDELSGEKRPGFK